MTTRQQHLTLALITLVALALIMVGGRDEIDCDNPHTWSTQTGVQHCAINGGK